MSPRERADNLEKNLKISLPLIKSIGFEDLKKVHCENLIGGTVLPLGVAGPLVINGEHIAGARYIPLATTEGALVASVNRGCKAVTRDGGATVRTKLTGITRAPVFEVKGIREGFAFKSWLDTHFADLAKEAQSTSSHLKLLRLEAKPIATSVYVRLYFDTGNAMGMNMATIAASAISRFIEKETGTVCLSLSGNYCVDKKPSFLNFISGRGREGWGEVVLTQETLEGILKVTASQLHEVWLAKCMTGSALSGSLGFNAHFANIIAAIYGATGQDMAHVVEGSMGITTVKILDRKSAYFAVYLPALVLGTVGGGTKLDIKKEALSIMGAVDSGTLAEATVGAVLAGELSLLSSLAQKTLAKAHKNLGR